MIATGDFVFAHLPKTGGVFLQSVIEEFFDVIESWNGADSHRSIELLDSEHRGKPVFALLRNPWAWYVSWFHYCEAQRDNPEFLLNHKPGPDAFRETIANLLHPNHSDAGINRFMREQDIGLLEMHRFHILDLECVTHRISYGRLERVAGDFCAFLRGVGIDIPPGLTAALAGVPSNTRRHGPWRNYYDDRLRKLVAHKERQVVSIGCYSFE